VPVQLIVGSEDSVPDVAFLEELSTRIHHVTTTIWPRANHDVPLEYGAACRVEIEKFLDRHPAGLRRAG
jgi:hypothetical protein